MISHATLRLLPSSPYFGVCGPEIHLPFYLPEVCVGPLRSLEGQALRVLQQAVWWQAEGRQEPHAKLHGRCQDMHTSTGVEGAPCGRRCGSEETPG